MLKIVCFKWHQDTWLNKFNAAHVNTLYAMLRRHLTTPFELLCFTDDDYGIDSAVTVLPLWDKCRHLGACFNRLYTFSDDMREVIGDRFACIDLDCVITANVDHIFNRDDDFIINSYKPLRHCATTKSQHYNGGLYLMNAGARRQVWDSFNFERSVEVIRNSPKVIGSDQAWIRLCLGKGEKRFTEQDGVYESRQHRQRLPENACMVFFAGSRDPQTTTWSWVKRHYRS